MAKQFDIDLEEYLKEAGGNVEHILYPDSSYYRKNKISVSLKAAERKYVPDSESKYPNKPV